jgi:hypothetical protein
MLRGSAAFVAMLLSCASLLPASSGTLGVGAVRASISKGASGAQKGAQRIAAFLHPTVRAPFGRPAETPTKTCPLSSSAYALGTARMPAWPLAMDPGGQRRQSSGTFQRDDRHGGGRDGRARPLFPSERRVLERQRRDGSISAEDLDRLKQAERSGRDRPRGRSSSPPPQGRGPRPPPAPPPEWAAARMGPMSATRSPSAGRVGRAELRVLQERRARGEISDEDLARLEQAEDAAEADGAASAAHTAARWAGNADEEMWGEDEEDLDGSFRPTLWKRCASALCPDSRPGSRVGTLARAPRRPPFPPVLTGHASSLTPY